MGSHCSTVGVLSAAERALIDAKLRLGSLAPASDRVDRLVRRRPGSCDRTIDVPVSATPFIVLATYPRIERNGIAHFDIVTRACVLRQHRLIGADGNYCERSPLKARHPSSQGRKCVRAPLVE
jgi:hypothetical protein